MAWVIFLVSSALIVVAAMKLAEYGDIIAYRTQLGGMFIGTLLMAGATSLPEFLTAINSLRQDVAGLAAGNMLGSNMYNMLLIGILSMIFYKARVLRYVAMKHALTGSVAMMLIGMATFFILADIDIRIGWVGLDSLLLMAAYMFGVWLIRSNDHGGDAVAATTAPEEIEGMPSLRGAFIGFGLATLALLLITPMMVRSSAEIAELTGLGAGFVGTALVAMITSLPELIAVVSAARIGAYDMAIGNLFGSNIFNMFALGFTDFFYLEGRFIGLVDKDFALVGLLGLLLTGMGLISNQARLERRIWLVEVDAVLLVIGYFVGMWFLYVTGIGV